MFLKQNIVQLRVSIDQFHPLRHYHVFCLQIKDGSRILYYAFRQNQLRSCNPNLLFYELFQVCRLITNNGFAADIIPSFLFRTQSEKSVYHKRLSQHSISVRVQLCHAVNLDFIQKPIQTLWYLQRTRNQNHFVSFERILSSRFHLQTTIHHQQAILLHCRGRCDLKIPVYNICLHIFIGKFDSNTAVLDYRQSLKYFLAAASDQQYFCIDDNRLIILIRFLLHFSCVTYAAVDNQIFHLHILPSRIISAL